MIRPFAILFFGFGIVIACGSAAIFIRNGNVDRTAWGMVAALFCMYLAFLSQLSGEKS